MKLDIERLYSASVIELYRRLFASKDYHIPDIKCVVKTCIGAVKIYFN